MLTNIFTSKKTSPHSAPNSNLVLIKNLNHYFGDCHALRNINFSVRRGEMLFITGASGAGKTTLLNIIAGKLAPLEGDISFSKGPMNEDLFVSSVFQDLRLMENENVLDNIEVSFDPTLYRNYKAFIADREELCRVFGIDRKTKMKMKDCNGGLRQKTAIVRALLARPDIYIADEPTSALDLDNAKKLFDVLNLYNVKRGLTVIWSSHNRELVKRFTGRLVHLENGNLIYSGNACFI